MWALMACLPEHTSLRWAQQKGPGAGDRGRGEYWSCWVEVRHRLSRLDRWSDGVKWASGKVFGCSEEPGIFMVLSPSMDQ